MPCPWRDNWQSTLCPVERPRFSFFSKNAEQLREAAVNLIIMSAAMQEPIAKTGMLIRKPVSEVFEAFVDPGITAKFWFDRGSDRLETGRKVRWEWDSSNTSLQVDVTAVEKDRRILIEWPAFEAPTSVELKFTSHEGNSTYVEIINSGFACDEATRTKLAVGSAEGFALILAGLKALLEHGVVLNLARDRNPILAGLAAVPVDSEAVSSASLSQSISPVSRQLRPSALNFPSPILGSTF
jgi:uncharacterized protein YndB with AHSA1/START domain